VVGGQHGHDRARRLRGDAQRRPRDGHGGVAALGFDEDAGRGQAALLANRVGVLLAADDPDPVLAREAARARERGVEQRTPADDAQERLRVAAARSRPESLACAARQDDRVQRRACGAHRRPMLQYSKPASRIPSGL